MSFLAIPLMWLLWPAFFGYDFFGFRELPIWLQWGIVIIMLGSQIISILVGVLALKGNPNTRTLIPWMITLPFYWPLGAIAGYKGLYEIIVKPFYWDKTSHGHAEDISPEQQEQDASLQPLPLNAAAS